MQLIHLYERHDPVLATKLLRAQEMAECDYHCSLFPTLSSVLQPPPSSEVETAAFHQIMANNSHVPRPARTPRPKKAYAASLFPKRKQPQPKRKTAPALPPDHLPKQPGYVFLPSACVTAHTPTLDDIFGVAQDNARHDCFFNDFDDDSWACWDEIMSS